MLVYCLNDISDDGGVNAAYEKFFPAEASSGWLRRNSYFLDTVYCRLRTMRNPYMRSYFDVVRKGYQGSVWEQQEQRLLELRDLVQSRGGRLSVVTFPFVHAVGPAYPYQPAHEQLERFWRESSVPHLDLLPLYRNVPPRQITVNRFDAHPSERARELATPVVEEFVKEQRAAAPRGAVPR